MRPCGEATGAARAMGERGGARGREPRIRPAVSDGDLKVFLTASGAEVQRRRPGFGAGGEFQPVSAT